MRISEITHRENEKGHYAALKKTGFFGEQGAGSLFLAKTTRRIGIVHRSANGRIIQQPSTWGTIGGAIDAGEDPMRAAIREAEEEVGYHIQQGDYLLPLDEFTSGTFRYSTYLYVVGDEFTGQLNWEAQGFAWFEFGKWPSPLHFGIQNTLAKPPCTAIIQTEIAKYQPNNT